MGSIQIIRTPAGEELVVLSRKEYDALVSAASAQDEDAEDVALYDARKAELAAEGAGTLPEAVGLLLLRGHSRLRAIRLWRGLSQSALAKAAAVGQGYLSDLESGRRTGSGEVLQALARELDVPAAWIS